MTHLPTKLFDRRGRISAVTRYALVAVGIFSLVPVLGGCSGLLPSLAESTPTGPSEAAVNADRSPASDTPGLAEVLAPTGSPAPETPSVPFPVGPSGYARLEDLESLYREALCLTAEADWDRARDHLFVLQDQVELPLPTDADSTYSAQRQSLSRRVWLLGGILTENEAFATAGTPSDSLLATGYGTLDQLAFPDSLVPATGVTLSPITADLLKVDNHAVAKWVDYFSGRGRRHFQIWLERKAEADSLVGGILDETGLPRELVYLAMIESGLSPRAVSSAQAVGPWQFMAGTAKYFDLKRNWWVDERRDLEMSTRAAARYLTQLHGQFGDWALVLAAYNSGENRITRRIRLQGHDNFWEMRLPRQTTDYVPKFIAAARIGENPEKYGFTIPPQRPIRYDVVPVDDATDLDLIARCAGVPAEKVASLNPALLRGASPAGMKNYPVRVPAGTGRQAAAALRKIPADRRLTWRRHQVKRGQTLGHISRQYGTTVTDIARLNKLGDVHLIRPGDQLLIPMPADLASKARQRAEEKGHYVPPQGFVRVSYKVKSGDTLGGVARKLGVTVSHLRKVNGIYKSHLIYPGQRLFAYRPGG